MRRIFPDAQLAVHSLTDLLPLYSQRKSSVTVLFDRHTSSANGAFGQQKRHDNAGTGAVTAAPRCQSSARRSTSPIVRQAALILSSLGLLRLIRCTDLTPNRRD